jgi:anti-sigma B factor antagonist
MKYLIENNEDIVIFKLLNETLNSDISPELKAKLLILCQPDIEALILDLSSVKTIDSSGIGSLLLAERQMNDHGLPVVLTGVNEGVQQILDMLHLADIFEIYPTVEEAVNAIIED